MLTEQENARIPELLNLIARKLGARSNDPAIAAEEAAQADNQGNSGSER
jgi:hypothetical protein